jgi:putative chitinase
MIPLSPDQLMLATGSNRANAELFLPFLQGTCKAYDITSPLRVAAFLSQIGHESGGLSQLEENLNYSAMGLAATWPTRFAQRDMSGAYLKDAKGRHLPTERARLFHRKPEMIANSVYANRMGNGSEESGDGWRHRGFGLKQLTGKNNQRACGRAIGENFELHPERLMLPVNAALSAGWFWSVNKLNRLADTGDVRGMTLAINGGTIGLAQREALYQQALPAFA